MLDAWFACKPCWPQRCCMNSIFTVNDDDNYTNGRPFVCIWLSILVTTKFSGPRSFCGVMYWFSFHIFYSICFHLPSILIAASSVLGTLTAAVERFASRLDIPKTFWRSFLTQINDVQCYLFYFTFNVVLQHVGVHTVHVRHGSFVSKYSVQHFVLLRWCFCWMSSDQNVFNFTATQKSVSFAVCIHRVWQ